MVSSILSLPAEYGEATATVRRIHLSPDSTPGHTHAENLTQESADKAAELLGANHVLYHNRWSIMGFHNQIPHHLLTLYSLGATPIQIQELYDYNTTYQFPIPPLSATNDGQQDIDLSNPTVFSSNLGKNELYASYLQYFENEIEKHGVENVLQEYVFRRDDRANDIFARLFTDFNQSIIHLGFGLEFQQPAIIAEALASACIHDNWPKTILLATETYVQENLHTVMKPLLELLGSMHEDPVIAPGVQSSDPVNKIRDGLLKRVPERNIVHYLAQIRVSPTPDELQQKLEENMLTSAYLTGAAQRPAKAAAIDYILMHTVTLGVHLPTIFALSWLSDADKARLLEAKTRMDALMYAGCGCPRLYPDRIRNYKPSHPEQSWDELIQRAVPYRDEGNVVKLMRGLYGVERWVDGSRIRPDFPLHKTDVVKVAHMALDSTERLVGPGGGLLPGKVAEAMKGQIGRGGEMVVSNRKRWVFYCGLNESWQFFPGTEVESR